MPATDAVLSTWPFPRSSMPGTKARMPRTMPSTLIWRIHSQSSMSTRSAGPSTATPALLQSRSTWPQRSMTWSRRASTSASLVTSQCTAMASVPAASSSARVDASRSSFTSAMATFAPRRAASRAMPRPMPLAPPVITTTASSNPSSIVTSPFDPSSLDDGPQKCGTPSRRAAAPTYPVAMADAPLLGTPTAISTHPDGRFSVEFTWERSPDALWLKAAADLMRRSGRESIEADTERLTITFYPQDADDAFDDLDVMLTEAERSYRNDLEQRESALVYIRESLQTRFGAGPDLPLREL